jgi:hypothetical protein
MYGTNRSNLLNNSALCTPCCVFGLCTAVRINRDYFVIQLYQRVFVTNMHFVFCEVETEIWCVGII